MIEVADVQRPTRVVVVDADDPMAEVRGEFFWVEDHERLLTAAREAAYRQGYDDGFAAGATHAGSSIRLVRVRRRSSVLARALVLAVVAAFLVTLISSILH